MTALIAGIDYDNLTKEQAVSACGAENVAKVDGQNCEFTNRVMTDGTAEFSASNRCTDADGESVTLVAYYYQDADDVDGRDDQSSLDWAVDHYAVR